MLGTSRSGQIASRIRGAPMGITQFYYVLDVHTSPVTKESAKQKQNPQNPVKQNTTLFLVHFYFDVISDLQENCKKKKKKKIAFTLHPDFSNVNILLYFLNPSPSPSCVCFSTIGKLQKC